MRCNYCHTVLRDGSRFCLNCGEPVDARACYIAELNGLKKPLSRKTDIDSLEHIISMINGLAEDMSDERLRGCLNDYLPNLISVMRKYQAAKPFASNSYLRKRFEKAEDALTKALDSTEQAFEIQLNEIYEEKFDAVETDAEVLNHKIIMDGMVESDFEL